MKSFPSLQISISAIGRFHMFDLARVLMSLGQSVSLYTGYPRFKVDPDLRPITRTRSRWVLATFLRRRFFFAPHDSWWEDRSLEDFGKWLRRTLPTERVDVLDALAGTGLEAGRELHDLGKPWICNRGSTHILTQKRLMEEEYARWGLRRPLFSDEGLDRALAEYEEADAIVVPAEFSRRSFLEHGVSPEKLFKSPYGVDLSLFRPIPVESGHPFRVVFVGTCSLRKGIGYLLEAMEPLVRKGKAETWLIGAASEESYDILQSHSGEFVYHGVKLRSELAPLLSQCDVLVLPSIEEGLALVMAQGMACGLPVIATPNTGAEDLFTDCVEGFIVPARDSLAIRHRVQWMNENLDRRQEMSQAAISKVKTLGGWRIYGERCLAIYQAVLQRKSPRSKMAESN